MNLQYIPRVHSEHLYRTRIQTVYFFVAGWLEGIAAQHQAQQYLLCLGGWQWLPWMVMGTVTHSYKNWLNLLKIQPFINGVQHRCKVITLKFDKQN